MRVSRKAAAGLMAAVCFMCNLAGVEARHHGDDADRTVVHTQEPAKKGPIRLLAKERMQAEQEKKQKKIVAQSVRNHGARPSLPQAMRMWPVESRDTGGTLLFSDSPEYVDRDGVLYRDTVKGEARILFYHLNHTNQPKKVAVVLEGQGKETSVVHITRGGMSAPNTDYLTVGKRTQTEYFDRKMDEVLYVGSKRRRLLQQAMGTTILQPGQLVYGVFDFTASHPVKVSVVMCPADNEPCEFSRWAKVLPKDEQRLRGTFKGMDRIVRSAKPYDPAKDGAVYFPLGDNERDRYRTGVDATDGSTVTNYGNYGVLYRIEIPTAGKDWSQFYLSPLGGVYAGAMSVTRPDGLSDLLLTPRGRTYFGDSTPPETPAEEAARVRGFAEIKHTTELADLGAYQNGLPVRFEYSPPGASNLPVNIIMMPGK